MRTVLVIDDDAPTLYVIRAILDRAGFQVLSASTRAAAAELCRKQQDLALVVSDVVLSQPDGVSVAETLRGMCPAPVLLVSGSPLDILVERGFLRPDDIVPGRCEFLPKPFTAVTLLEAVNRLATPEEP